MDFNFTHVGRISESRTLNVKNKFPFSIDVNWSLLKVYDKVSEKFGYEVLPTESLVNQLGYAFMGRSDEKAKAFLQLNIDNFPKSANAFDSMGDYYLSVNDTLNAIQNLEKAIELGDLDLAVSASLDRFAAFAGSHQDPPRNGKQ